MANSFGPLSTGRSSVSIITSETFSSSWTAQFSSEDGKVAKAEYKMCMPTGEPAHFHMLLDASGSTLKKVQSGDKRPVFEHLFRNFSELVTKGDTFRPQDMIHVWSFNKRTRLLCSVECNDFYSKLDFIRNEYAKELGGDNYNGTRLYDAVGEVMSKIKETHRVQPKADYFLVPFTDGRDNRSKVVDLSGMMDKISSLKGRLHTFFITVNMPTYLDLYKRLAGQQSEITFFNCENSEPNEIARAFNTLREMIKAFLLLEYSDGKSTRSTRIVDYGHTKKEVADRMVKVVTSQMRIVNILEGLESSRRLGPSNF